MQRFFQAVVSQWLLFSECRAVLQLRGSAAIVDENPLLQVDELPRFANVNAKKHARAAVRHSIEEARNRTRDLELHLTQKLAKNDSIAYEDVAVPLQRIYDGSGRPWGILNHLQSVKDEPALREAIAELEPDLVKFYQELGQSRPLYEAFVRLKDGAAWTNLSEARQRIVRREVDDRVLSGVALNEKDAKEFNDVHQQLSKLSSEFSNHVLDATAAWNLTVHDPERLRGVPARALELAAANARKAGVSNASGSDGPWVLTMDGALIGPVMAHAENRELRETLFWASATLASSGREDNTPTINGILQNRQRSAALLGYDSYANLSFASKMAKHGEVYKLMNEIHETAKASADDELLELQEFAQTTDQLADVRPWDKGLYIEKMKQKKFSFDSEAMRTYFALPTVVDGLFSLSTRLFGTEITEVTADGTQDILWNDDVKLYKVARDGIVEGHIFLDPYSRPGQKKAGAWVQPLVSRSREPGSETLQHPAAAVVLNLPPPQGEKPSLLSIGEVETVFHEFGHALQHVLTVQDDSAVAGLSGIEWDAVEISSQFMEYWVSEDRRTLYSMAKHYETSEPMPEELYQQWKASKNFRAASVLVGQVYLGTVDLRLHEHYEKGEDIFAIDHEIAAGVLAEAPPKAERHLCSFSHIFAGGYAAGYYSYQWSKVLSADAFSAFEEHGGLADDIQVAAIGRRFASTFLALGGGRAPASVFQDFRGRQPSTLALLKYSGLHNS